MSVATWRKDVELFLETVEKDQRLLERIGKRLRADEKEVLEAVVRTHGDPKAMVEQLGPIAIARLKARGVTAPKRLREPAAKAWNVVRVPLKAAWRPPAKPTPQKLAQTFLDKYNARLTTLTTDAKAADKAVTALAESLRMFGASKELLDLATGLHGEVQKLQAIAAKCTHVHHDAGKWASECSNLVRESAQTLQLVRNLAQRMDAMVEQLEELSDCIWEWTEAKPVDRAASAETMAVRIKAASDVVASMREDFLALVFAKS